MKTWMRILYVTFSKWDDNKAIVYGKTWDDSKKPRIEVTGTKYLSTIKDNFTIRIYNLPYDEVLKIQLEKKFHVCIYAGYVGDQPYGNFVGEKIFDGGLINITSNKGNFKDQITSFVCASRTIAQQQEYRLNISLCSGMNMYSAINYICNISGIKRVSISDEYKYRFLKEIQSSSNSVTSYVDYLSQTNNDQLVIADSSTGSELSFATSNSSKEVIVLDPRTGMVINNQPEITSAGVTWESLPIRNYTCGSLVKIDPSYLNVSSGQDNKDSFINGAPNTYYISSSGLYYISQLDYTLSNSSGSFEIKITAKSKDLYDTAIGNSGISSS